MQCKNNNLYLLLYIYFLILSLSLDAMVTLFQDGIAIKTFPRFIYQSVISVSFKTHIRYKKKIICAPVRVYMTLNVWTRSAKHCTSFITNHTTHKELLEPITGLKKEEAKREILPTPPPDLNELKLCLLLGNSCYVFPSIISINSNNSFLSLLNLTQLIQEINIFKYKVVSYIFSHEHQCKCYKTDFYIFCQITMLKNIIQEHNVQ